MIKIVLLAVTMQLISVCSFAREIKYEQRAVCGEYSFIVPGGFITTKIVQKYNERIFINTSSNNAYAKGTRGVSCIELKNDKKTNIILDIDKIYEVIPGSIVELPIQVCVKYIKSISHDVKLYGIDASCASDTPGTQDLRGYIISMGEAGESGNGILYVWDIGSRHKTHKKERLPLDAIGREYNRENMKYVSLIMQSIKKANDGGKDSDYGK